MTSTYDAAAPTVESVWDAVVGVRQALRWFAGLDLGFLLDEDVDALLPEVEEVARTVPVVRQALTGQVLDRGMAETYGCTSPVAYLQAKLRLRRSGSARDVAAVRPVRRGERRHPPRRPVPVGQTGETAGRDP